MERMLDDGRRSLDELGHAAESRYRGIVEGMSEGVLIVDATGHVTFVNAALVTMLRYSREDELVGRHFADLYFPEELEGTTTRWPALLARDSRPLRVERRLKARDGQEVWTSSATVTLREGSGAGSPPAALLAIITDITEARRLEQKLQQTQKLESLGVLAGGIAHDFNNLLVGVLGNAGLARSELAEKGLVLESIDEIETAARRASELTRQLLAYAGKGRFVIGRVNVRRLVEEMGQLLATAIGKGVALRYQFDDGVPDVMADATQLRQVVMNLMTNASDAIGDASGVIRVSTHRVEADAACVADSVFQGDLAPGSYVMLEVSDTGSGMSAETCAHIFDPFFTTKFTGRGLGLAAVQGILRGHQGAIRVDSEPGRGTTFRVLLPAMDGAPELERPARQPAAPTKAGGTILVADDDPMVRSVVRRVLERAGYEVVLAFDGAEALAVFGARRGEIRGVILDVTMPTMGGVEALRRLREIDPVIPVLLASGYAEQETSIQLAGDGFATLLEKPFPAQALVEKVEAMLSAAGEAPAVT